jgi:DNA invertase Pin-like site-specific DNA recombinase
MNQPRQDSRRFGYLALRPDTASTSRQHTAMLAGGLDRLFIDVIQPPGQRRERDAAIDALAAGDVLITPALDMAVDSVADLVAINARVEAKGAFLIILQVTGGLTLDTRQPEGRAILGALAVIDTFGDGSRGAPVAQPGATAPMLRGRGRPATAMGKSDEIVRLYAQGVRAVEIAQRLGIGRASVYRMLSQELPLQAAAQATPPSASRRATDVVERVRRKMPVTRG